MIGKLSLTSRLDSSIEKLIFELDANRKNPLETMIVLVPNGAVKNWLLLEIAKAKGVAMGLKVIEIEQLLPPSIHSVSMAAMIYKELEISNEPEVLAYVGGKKKRRVELTELLASLFFTYGQFGKELFQKPPSNWQERLLHKLFCQGSFRLPVQMNPSAKEQIFCFGIDFLPPVYWDFLFQSPSLSLYLFSPCAHFWEDLCSDRERKRVGRFWKKRGASKKGREALDDSLRHGPRNLANWGKIGRETLKYFDRFDLEIEELYPSLEPDSVLKQIQFDLLTFQETKTDRQDDSFKVFLTGSSPLKEIECLRDEIIRLQIPYSEISVLAPDIEPYVPLIQFLFADQIPYRISGFDIAPKSSFRWGLVRLIELGSARWEAEELLTLFETPSFTRKRGWEGEKLELYREWVAHARIEWGIDSEHRRKYLSASLGEGQYEDFGSWEKGLDFLLHAIVSFSSLSIDRDLFEEMIQTIEELKKLSFHGEKTFKEWAELIEFAAAQFLEADPEDEADASCVNQFAQFLTALRNCEEEGLFPIELVKRFLSTRCSGHIHSTHLHGVRFFPIDEGALIPAKALFLIGMDEEQFPRERKRSSLDLLKGIVPDQAERDRYLFLQALFSAQEVLRISYGHLSPDEGKPVGPSLLVQELLSGLKIQPEIYRAAPLPSLVPSLSWPRREERPLPEGEIIVSVSDLRLLARHPWKFYLAKGMGLYVDSDWEESFALEKGRALRSTLEKPVDLALKEGSWVAGPIGKALQSDVIERAAEWKERLDEWQVEPFSLVLRQNCETPHWEEERYVVPPIELRWENLVVSLVGEVAHATTKGLISSNDDSIGGALKIWPDALVVALALSGEQIFMLKNGKVKTIEEAEKGLKAFLEYYFAALRAPSPLLPDWADSLLRKGGADLEKKMEKESMFEDPLVDWIFARGKIPAAEELVSDWGLFLQERFEPLIQLYPTRGKNHAAV